MRKLEKEKYVDVFFQFYLLNPFFMKTKDKAIPI